MGLFLLPADIPGFPVPSFCPPGGLFAHLFLIGGLSIQAKVEENVVFMRLLCDKKISSDANLGKFFCAA